MDVALWVGHSVSVTGHQAAEELIEFEFDDVERDMLWRGLLEWSGPARCTDELAVAMGYPDVNQMFAEQQRLKEAIKSEQPLSRFDWVRVVLGTEIVFASSLVGGGGDWSIMSGMSDELSIATLRSIQKKVTRELRGLIRDGFGTRAERA